MGHVEVARGFYFDSVDINNITNLDNLEFQFFENLNNLENVYIEGLKFSTLSQDIFT